MTAPNRRTDAAGGAARRTRGERRRELLALARRLFAEQGYPETTVESIAEAAGVTLAAFHRHFKDKPALLEGILQETRAAVQDAWRAASAEVTDPLARLHALADLFLASLRPLAEERRIIQRCLADGDEEAAEPLRTFFLDGETMLVGLLSDGQQSGVFRRSLDPRVGAWQLLQAALGFLLTQPLDAPLFAEADYMHRAVDCLLHGLLKTDV
jgi:AcrR family transcriptional regulator